MSHKNDFELMRKIFDAMPSMVFVVDKDVRVYEFNKAAAEFIGMERSAILKHRGGEILKCMHTTEATEGCGNAPYCEGCMVRNSVKNAFAGNYVERARAKMELIRGEHKTEIYAHISASPFSYKERDLVLLVIENISILTELKRIIPICSICHKIRDQEEAWSRIEAYFKANWDVDFSHSFCPDCYDELVAKE